MEFRQVVSVCRSAGAVATRPSLASTRPSPSSILLQQRYFTNNPKQQSEAAAAAAADPQPQTLQYQRITRLQNSISQNRLAPTPPRPPLPPFRQNMLDGQKRDPPSWAIPPKTGSGGGRSPLLQNTMLTGRAPTSSGLGSGSGGSGSGLYNLASQITSDMERATGAGPASGRMNTWNEDAFLPKHYDVTEPELRLRPSTGRTVDIKGSVDLARGFRLLQRSVSQNRIKSDVREAKAYERPALKRKRLKRERWQVRFKEGFRACVVRAMELKGQGW